MNLRQIFETQQQVVSTGSQRISAHLTRIQTLIDRVNNNNNIHSRYAQRDPLIALRTWGSEELIDRERGGLLGLVDIIPTEDNNNNNPTSNEIKQLAALTIVCDEIWCLERHAQDALYANLCSKPNRLDVHNAHRVGLRLQSLAKNLLLQLSGLLQPTTSIFKRGVETAIPCWFALADAISTMACLDHLMNDSQLIRSLLLDNVFACVARETLGICCGTVLRQWLESLQQPKLLQLKDGMRVCALYVVAYRLGLDKDGSLFSRVWNIQNHSPLHHIVERKVIKLDEFLTKHTSVPSSAVRKPSNPAAARRAAAMQLVTSLTNVAKRVAREVLNNPTLDLAQRTHRIIVLTLSLHACESVPLPRSAVRPLAILIESLKTAETTLLQQLPNLSLQFHQQMMNGINIPPLVQALLNRAPRSALSPTRCVSLWIAACACPCQTISSSQSPTNKTITVTYMTSPTLQSRPLPCEASYVREVKQACDVSGFLRGFPELFKPLLGDAFSDMVGAHVRVPLLVRALTCGDGDAALLSTVETCVVDPLCLDVEHDLREYALLGDPSDFPRLPLPAKSHRLAKLVHIPALAVMGGHTIKQRVLYRLSKVFHELVAVSPGLWDVYSGQMKAAAKLLYGLDIDLCVFLQPASDFSAQGNTLLDVMKDVAGFASRFNYNLNEELFVERKVNNRHVSTITVELLHARLMAQGLGMLPTMVDSMYQFLVGKFETLSQLLYDDQVRTFLKRERRWLSKERASAVTTTSSTPTVASVRFYPYEKASSFYSQVKPSLGAAAPYLSKLRSTISEIGNVLGLVRCLQSAMATSSSYPGLEETPKEQQYLTLLLCVFKQALTSKTTSVEHLENTFMIIPCLCLNYVAASLQAKDLVVRASKASGGSKDVYFTDDGFAFGIAAILGVLEQDSSFDALYWFRSVASYYESTAFPQAAAMMANAQDFASSTAAKKTRAEAREHELLMYAFTFARVLVKRSLVT